MGETKGITFYNAVLLVDLYQNSWQLFRQSIIMHNNKMIYTTHESMESNEILKIAFDTSVRGCARCTQAHMKLRIKLYKTYSALECNYTVEALWKRSFGCL